MLFRGEVHCGTTPLSCELIFIIRGRNHCIFTELIYAFNSLFSPNISVHIYVGNFIV